MSFENEIEKGSSLGADSTLPHRNDLFSDETVDPVYQAKAHVLNQAIQEIGMGKYQWYLFVVAGFGWVADAGWWGLNGNILYPVVTQYQFNPPLLSLAMAIGFFVGASLWGLSSDIWGRRLVFNITLLIGGIFGIASGGSNSFVMLASLLAVVGVGIGGNVPVDSAVFLDFVPGSHQYLLTSANFFYGIGNSLASGIAWAVVPKHSCSPPPAICTDAENIGWRRYCYVNGGLTIFLWTVRFLLPLFESPRYLVGRGKDEEAVKVIHGIAKINGKTSSLTVEKLREAACEGGKISTESTNSEKKKSECYIRVALRHTGGIFATRKMALSTSLLLVITLFVWTGAALYAYFIPYIMATRGVAFGDASLYTVYRNQFIITCGGIPAGILAGYLVERPFLGRKGVLFIFTAFTGAVLLGSTTARSSNALLVWNVTYVFIAYIGYSSLNAIGPETFHGQHRGTGAGLQSTVVRVAGIIGPIIALYANLATAVPVYIAGALTICGALLALLIPYEPRGHSSI